jgi:hypothetical protein
LNRGRGARWRRGSFFFSLLDCLEHVAGLRDARPVDLRLGRSAFAASCGRSARSAALKVGAHTLGFIKLKRTGVRLLLSDAYVIKYVEDSFALDFQFTR